MRPPVPYRPSGSGGTAGEMHTEDAYVDVAAAHAICTALNVPCAPAQLREKLDARRAAVEAITAGTSRGLTLSVLTEMILEIERSRGVKVPAATGLPATLPPQVADSVRALRPDAASVSDGVALLCADAQAARRAAALEAATHPLGHRGGPRGDAGGALEAAQRQGAALRQEVMELRDTVSDLQSAYEVLLGRLRRRDRVVEHLRVTLHSDLVALVELIRRIRATDETRVAVVGEDAAEAIMTVCDYAQLREDDAQIDEPIVAQELLARLRRDHANAVEALVSECDAAVAARDRAVEEAQRNLEVVTQRMAAVSSELATVQKTLSEDEARRASDAEAAAMRAVEVKLAALDADCVRTAARAEAAEAEARTLRQQLDDLERGRRTAADDTARRQAAKDGAQAQISVKLQRLEEARQQSVARAQEEAQDRVRQMSRMYATLTAEVADHRAQREAADARARQLDEALAAAVARATAASAAAEAATRMLRDAERLAADKTAAASGMKEALARAHADATLLRAESDRQAAAAAEADVARVRAERERDDEAALRQRDQASASHEIAMLQADCALLRERLAAAEAAASSSSDAEPFATTPTAAQLAVPSGPVGKGGRGGRGGAGGRGPNRTASRRFVEVRVGELEGAIEALEARERKATKRAEDAALLNATLTSRLGDISGVASSASRRVEQLEGELAVATARVDQLRSAAETFRAKAAAPCAACAERAAESRLAAAQSHIRRDGPAAAEAPPPAPPPPPAAPQPLTGMVCWACLSEGPPAGAGETATETMCAAVHAALSGLRAAGAPPKCVQCFGTVRMDRAPLLRASSTQTTSAVDATAVVSRWRRLVAHSRTGTPADGGGPLSETSARSLADVPAQLAQFIAGAEPLQITRQPTLAAGAAGGPMLMAAGLSAIRQRIATVGADVAARQHRAAVSISATSAGTLPAGGVFTPPTSPPVTSPRPHRSPPPASSSPNPPQQAGAAEAGGEVLTPVQRLACEAVAALLDATTSAATPTGVSTVAAARYAEFASELLRAADCAYVAGLGAAQMETEHSDEVEDRRQSESVASSGGVWLQERRGERVAEYEAAQVAAAHSFDAHIRAVEERAWLDICAVYRLEVARRAAARQRNATRGAKWGMAALQKQERKTAEENSAAVFQAGLRARWAEQRVRVATRRALDLLLFRHHDSALLPHEPLQVAALALRPASDALGVAAEVFAGDVGRGELARVLDFARDDSALAITIIADPAPSHSLDTPDPDRVRNSGLPAAHIATRTPPTMPAAEAAGDQLGTSDASLFDAADGRPDSPTDPPAHVARVPRRHIAGGRGGRDGGGIGGGSAQHHESSAALSPSGRSSRRTQPQPAGGKEREARGGGRPQLRVAADAGASSAAPTARPRAGLGGGDAHASLASPSAASPSAPGGASLPALPGRSRPAPAPAAAQVGAGSTRTARAPAPAPPTKRGGAATLAAGHASTRPPPSAGHSSTRQAAAGGRGGHPTRRAGAGAAAGSVAAPSPAGRRAPAERVEGVDEGLVGGEQSDDSLYTPLADADDLTQPNPPTATTRERGETAAAAARRRREESDEARAAATARSAAAAALAAEEALAVLERAEVEISRIPSPAASAAGASWQSGSDVLQLSAASFVAAVEGDAPAVLADFAAAALAAAARGRRPSLVAQARDRLEYVRVVRPDLFPAPPVRTPPVSAGRVPSRPGGQAEWGSSIRHVARRSRPGASVGEGDENGDLYDGEDADATPQGGEEGDAGWATLSGGAVNQSGGVTPLGSSGLDGSGAPLPDGSAARRVSGEVAPSDIRRASSTSTAAHHNAPGAAAHPTPAGTVPVQHTSAGTAAYPSHAPRPSHAASTGRAAGPSRAAAGDATARPSGGELGDAAAAASAKGSHVATAGPAARRRSEPATAPALASGDVAAGGGEADADAAAGEADADAAAAAVPAREGEADLGDAVPEEPIECPHHHRGGEESAEDDDGDDDAADAAADAAEDPARGADGAEPSADGGDSLAPGAARAVSAKPGGRTAGRRQSHAGGHRTCSCAAAATAEAAVVHSDFTAAGSGSGGAPRRRLTTPHIPPTIPAVLTAAAEQAGAGGATSAVASRRGSPSGLGGGGGTASPATGRRPAPGSGARMPPKGVGGSGSAAESLDSPAATPADAVAEATLPAAAPAAAPAPGSGVAALLALRAQLAAAPLLSLSSADGDGAATALSRRRFSTEPPRRRDPAAATSAAVPAASPSPAPARSAVRPTAPAPAAATGTAVVAVAIPAAGGAGGAPAAATAATAAASAVAPAGSANTPDSNVPARGLSPPQPAAGKPAALTGSVSQRDLVLSAGLDDVLDDVARLASSRPPSRITSANPSTHAAALTAATAATAATATTAAATGLSSAGLLTAPRPVGLGSMLQVGGGSDMHLSVHMSVSGMAAMRMYVERDAGSASQFEIPDDEPPDGGDANADATAPPPSAEEVAATPAALPPPSAPADAEAPAPRPGVVGTPSPAAAPRPPPRVSVEELWALASSRPAVEMPSAEWASALQRGAPIGRDAAAPTPAGAAPTFSSPAGAATRPLPGAGRPGPGAPPRTAPSSDAAASGAIGGDLGATFPPAGAGSGGVRMLPLAMPARVVGAQPALAEAIEAAARAAGVRPAVPTAAPAGWEASLRRNTLAGGTALPAEPGEEAPPPTVDGDGRGSPPPAAPAIPTLAVRTLVLEDEPSRVSPAADPSSCPPGTSRSEAVPDLLGARLHRLKATLAAAHAARHSTVGDGRVGAALPEAPPTAGINALRPHIPPTQRPRPTSPSQQQQLARAGVATIAPPPPSVVPPASLARTQPPTHTAGRAGSGGAHSTWQIGGGFRVPPPRRAGPMPPALSPVVVEGEDPTLQFVVPAADAAPWLDPSRRPHSPPHPTTTSRAPSRPFDARTPAQPRTHTAGAASGGTGAFPGAARQPPPALALEPLGAPPKPALPPAAAEPDPREMQAEVTAHSAAVVRAAHASVAWGRLFMEERLRHARTTAT